MGWIFARSLSGAFFVTAILSMVYYPLGSIFPNIQKGVEFMLMWLPLIIFVLVFVATILGFLLVWWLQGKPVLLSDSEKFTKIESDIEEIKGQIKELKREIGNNHNL